MLARLVQLAARFIAALLTAVAIKVFGAEAVEGQEETIAGLAGGVAAALGAVVAWAIDLAIHKAETGGFLTRAGDRVVKR